MKRILLIDGSRDAELEAALREAGYGCVRAGSVREALPAAESGRIDLAVLDAGMPDAHPADSIALLRASGQSPILVIASAGERERLIELLDGGADDYLTRPFERRELAVRIEVLLLRRAGRRPPQALRHRDLELDPSTFSVSVRGEPVKLTKQEFRILELMLLSPPGRVFSKQDFFDYAWEHGYLGIDKTINVHICNIRRKLKRITDEPYIETIWGLGFRLM